MNQQPKSDMLVVNYLWLRKLIGFIGISLPFVLALGMIALEGPGIETSISAYYYTSMRDIFVGSLFAIGVFLFSYKGYERGSEPISDNMAGNLAGIFVIGVALLPCAPDVNPTSLASRVGAIHLILAALFFMMLAYFSLVLFRKTDPTKDPSRKKLQRNRVYKVCGWTILSALFLAMLATQLPDGSSVNRLRPVFLLESVAIVAFGVSWITKGEAILGDPDKDEESDAERELAVMARD